MGWDSCLPGFLPSFLSDRPTFFPLPLFKGDTWREKIRVSARKEFEDARHEPDPEIVNRLIIGGRDCVQRTVEAFSKRRNQIIKEEAEAKEAGKPPLWPPHA